MSLINNALKKAQRQRAAEAEATSPGSNTPMRRGKSGMPAQTLILIVAGAAVIVVLSVVATVYLLRPAPEPLPAAPIPPVQIAAVESTPAPSITVPPLNSAEPEPTEPEPVTNSPAPEPSPEPPPETTPVEAPAEVIAPAIAIAQSPPPEPARADERIYAFIDKLQVMGVRSSGADSKVLMNDKVYRLNDLVDRALALRLIKVSANSLVFEDANGITYTKTF